VPDLTEAAAVSIYIYIYLYACIHLLHNGLRVGFRDRVRVLGLTLIHVYICCIPYDNYAYTNIHVLAFCRCEIKLRRPRLVYTYINIYIPVYVCCITYAQICIC